MKLLDGRISPIFTQALGLMKPWNVVDVIFSKESGRLDLKIDFPSGATFLCPTCGKSDYPVHNTKERTRRHLNFFQYETYIYMPESRESAVVTEG